MQALGLLNPQAVLKDDGQDDGHTFGEFWSYYIKSVIINFLKKKNHLLMLPTESAKLAHMLSYQIIRSL